MECNVEDFGKQGVTPGHNEVVLEGGSPPTVNISMEPAPTTAHLEEEKTVYLNEQQCSEVMKILKQQRIQGKFCDVLVTAQNKNIWCHGCVLAANFIWFHNYNAQTVIHQEDTLRPKAHIHIECEDVKVLEAVLDYAYTGYLSVSMGNTEELLTLALKFMCDDITQCCSLHLEKNLDIASWHHILGLSVKYNLPDLEGKVMGYCIDNFSLIAQDDKILLVDHVTINLIISRFNSEGSKDREIYKLVVILRWTVHDYENRSKYLAPLLASVIKENVTKEDMEDVIEGVLGDQPDHEVLKQKDFLEFNDVLSKEERSTKMFAASNAPDLLSTNDGIKESTTTDNDPTLKSQIEIHSDSESLDELAGSIDYKTPEESELEIKISKPSTSPGTDPPIHDIDIHNDKAEQSALEEQEIALPSQKEFTRTLDLCEAVEQKNEEKSELHPSPGNVSHTPAIRPGRKTRKPSKYALYTDMEMKLPKRTNKEQSAPNSTDLDMLDAELLIGKSGKKGCKRASKKTTQTVERMGSKTDLSAEDQKEPNPEPSVTADSGKKKTRKRSHPARIVNVPSSPEREEDWFGPEILPIQKRFRGKKARTEEEMYACERCPRKFTTPSKLHHHILAHGSDTPYLCETCGFATKHYSSMNVHKKRHLGKDFKCALPGCDFSTMIRSRYDDHIDAHKGLKNHMCSICGKAFAGRKHMQRHEKIHNIKNPRNCVADGCDYSTGRTDKLKDHIMQHHTDMAMKLGYGKTIPCKVEGCDFKCVLQSQLKDHIKRFHPDKAVELGYVKGDTGSRVHFRDFKAMSQLLKQRHDKGYVVKRSIIESVTNFDPAAAGSAKLQLCFNPKGTGSSASNVLKLITARPVIDKRKAPAPTARKTPSILDGLSVPTTPLLSTLHKKPTPVAMYKSSNEFNVQQNIEEGTPQGVSVGTPVIVLKTITSNKNDIGAVEGETQQQADPVQQPSNTWVLNIAPSSQY